MARTVRESTTVVIVGGGVAGLTAAALLHGCGIECVVLERRSRAHIEQRQRAGIVEYRGVRMFREWGLADRVLGGFPADSTMEIRVDGRTRLLGRDSFNSGLASQLCPQQALVRNLIAVCLEDGGDLRFEAAEVALHGLDSDRPVVSYTDPDGEAREIECSFVAGCDGDRGICRASIPPGVLTPYSFDYGFSWLTVLADAPPPAHPLMAVGERGFAAHFARGPKASRFYLECAREDRPEDWPEERMWGQLRERLARDDLPAGPITDTELFPLRSLVHEPMTYGRLYLLGDAAHIISPMTAKGMNLALFDAEVFAAAVRDYRRDGDDTGLRSYSDTCLARTWNYQEYTTWMTEMLHGACGGGADPFSSRLARARLDRLFTSATAGQFYAEFATGLA